MFEGLIEAMLARRSKGLDSGSPGPDFRGFGPGPGGNIWSVQLRAKVRLHITARLFQIDCRFGVFPACEFEQNVWT